MIITVLSVLNSQAPNILYTKGPDSKVRSYKIIHHNSITNLLTANFLNPLRASFFSPPAQWLPCHYAPQKN